MQTPSVCGTAGIISARKYDFVYECKIEKNEIHIENQN